MFAISFRLPPSQALGVARRRVGMIPSEYYALPQEYRRFAFTISGLAGLEQIERVQQSLRDALAAGQSFSDWKGTLEGSVATLPLARLELIFRTHAQTAYMGGHWRAMTANAARRPFWMYSAINDERTRPAHRAMSGYIARWDDPIWQKWFPPAGFNCRCTVISLTEAQARARGWPMDDRAAEPDRGFAGVPSGEPEKLERELRQRLYTLGSPFLRAYERALAAMLRPAWLNRSQLSMGKIGLAAAARENPQLLELTPAEFFAIRRYSGKDYQEINRRLRYDAESSGLRPIQLGMVQSLASAVHKLEVGIEREIFRGMRLTRSGFEQLLRDIQKGRVAVTSGFFSTSLDRDEAENFSRPTRGKPWQVMFEIRTRRGVRITDISALAHELEILIAPGGLFVVEDVLVVGRVMVVRLRDGAGRPTIGLSA